MVNDRACLDEDGLLSYLAGPTADVEEHLAACVACRATIRYLVRDGDEARSADAGLAPTLVEVTAARRQVSLPHGARLGRYVIGRRLGEGGLGVVYAAHDPQLARDVAIKVMRDPSASASLTAEARAIARLAHPNVVAVHDLGEHEGRTFVVMELVDSNTLAWWQSVQRRSPREIVAMYRRAGEGLAAAHAAGLIHRDVKPSNVLVDADGRPRVSDFGLALLAADAPGARAAGTPAYTSPEAYAGRPLDARSDQFSFAVALDEALEGRRPFATASEVAVGPPPMKARVPRRIENAIVRALAADPAKRFESMSELDRALHWRSRGRVVAFAAFAAAGLGAVVVVTAIRSPRTDPCADVPTLGVTPSARTLVLEKFAGASQPAAGVATAARLDQYATTWNTARTAVCRASVRSDRDDDAALRLGCLAERRQEWEVALATLERADATTVANAPELVGSLVDVEACADVDTLRRHTAVIGDRAAQQRVSELRQQVLEWRALGTTGEYARAVSLAPALRSAVDATRYQPLIAEARLAEAELAEQYGGADQAAGNYRDAILAAEAGGEDLVAARAWLGLARQAAVQRSDVASARDALAHGTALIDRLGLPELRARLASTNGFVARMAGDYRGAIAGWYEATRIWALSTRGADGYEALRDHINAAVLHALTEDRATGELDDAIDRLRIELGPRHGAVGQALVLRAQVAVEQYDFDRAQQLFADARKT